MSEFKVGAVGWFDLTVHDAPAIRAFYETVVGWKGHHHPMGEYADFDMRSAEGKTVTGICHARGVNADLPAQWLIYINVADVDASAGRCVESGGAVVTGPRLMGKQRFCVIRDPAGAMAVLIGPPQ
jgi:predicted enzyme related to lactoylglutathione lyase